MVALNEKDTFPILIDTQLADLVAFVRPLQGTDSHFNFSYGNCLPLVSRPFGMTDWCPQTAALPGDEDNGEMSAWYVLSALGLFPLCPGHPSYVLGSPLFAKATLHVVNGNTLEIEVPGQRPAAVYVGETQLDGERYTRRWITHERRLRGGRLSFAMAAMPDEARVLDEDDLPYSLSRDGL